MSIPELPIFAILLELEQALSDSLQVILQAEPGAGKSTQVPLALLKSAQFAEQKIIMLEPRRIAAKRLAQFLAQQLQEKVGQTVGYRVRNQTLVSEKTRLEIVTEGVLTRMLQADPELQGVGLVIFDEFHERSLQADLGLSLLLDVQSALREDLHCLIMSATLDQDALCAFLPEARVLSCSGRAFPVDVTYHPAPTHTPMWQLPQLAAVLKQALQESDGDILLFFAGQGEILQAMRTIESVCDAHNAIALPLYGQLKAEEQDKVFASSHQRKVIFSTNIAQTSLTLEGITAVIDSGLEKVSRYDPRVGMSRLALQRISQASATQRMGRAGRVQAGRCYRLWSETQQQSLEKNDSPEILNADLSGVRMELAQWGAHVCELQWLDEPPNAHVAAAETLLQSLQFLQANGRLSAEGEQAASLHPEPRFAKLLQVAQQKNVLQLGCDVVALLQEGEVLRDGVSIDIEHRLHALWAALRAPKDKSLTARFKTAQWFAFLQSRRRLYQKFHLDVNDLKAEAQAQACSVGSLLALAFPDRIGKQRGKSATYKLANGRGVALPDNEALQPEYIVALNVDAQAQQGRVFLAAALDWQEVAPSLPLHEKEHLVFDSGKQRVIAEKQTWLNELLIDSTPLKSCDAESAQACLLEAVRQNFSLLPWSKAAISLQQRAQWLSQFSGFEAMGKLSMSSLSDSMDWLEPYTLNMNSVAQLQSLNVFEILQGLLDYSDVQQLQQQAPQFYKAPSGRECAIEYAERQAKVSLQLQQLFGELASPKLAGGQVALIFELLSPAQRPIQVTADLANFWTSSYFDVAKEMRGRYPKHRWPDEPLKEKAGRSIKPR